jgi:hypothetical protein
MFKKRCGGEEGQFFPVFLAIIFLVAVASLFTVQYAWAGRLRTHAQAAADAAALAAADEIRDRAIASLSIGQPAYGLAYDDQTSAQAAEDFAERNDANLLKVEERGLFRRAVYAKVESEESQGGWFDSDNNAHAEAEAYAEVVFPPCFIDSNDPDHPDSSAPLICNEEIVGFVGDNEGATITASLAPLFKVRLIDHAPPAPTFSIPAGGVSNEANRQLGKQMAEAYGWTGAEWTCYDLLIQSESSWDHTAENPDSGAYGIPQALPPEKMASAGSDWQTNPMTQIAWGLDYVANRYGTPCQAWAFKQANNWY